MRFVLCACSALVLAACGASVRAEQDGSTGAGDGTVPRMDVALPRDSGVVPFDTGVSLRDSSVLDTGVVIDTGVPTDSAVPPPDSGTIRGEARGEWRMTTFRFSLNGVPTQLTDVNRSLPGDPVNRYRINGTLDITSNRLAFGWGVLRNDHAFISDPTVDIDEGYSLTAFYWNGMLDDVAQRFVTGAVSLDYSFDSANVLRLSSAREGWTALFVRDPRTTLPFMTNMMMDGTALQISASTSDRFVQPRVALLWDVPSTPEVLEAASVPVSFSLSGVATYRMTVPSVNLRAVRPVGNVLVAFAHIVIYDDVDRSGQFNSSMAGGVGPDILRGVSPIGIGARSPGMPDATFNESPFRLLKDGWQFVNVERNSEPRPAVLIPYAMGNPVRPDVPVSETAVRRRILDLL